ncbi:pyridoxamine 5'-phosphate oxidase family protein [Actinoplanes sichuanensis]|uniref:Pyridoxamine 5'-phosphate oxidase family protein n=1 Tax=Actinoplanes sichuanensis TaxID=512349 RepID=A0ABW4AJL8_9ACTN|nr:pyridoxamine 5'-phosphate oxidase family protein [Actinoplanes sichuanensis]BEL04013.1 pyridoxamine 5'-phosphate oxidase family protein [Actinoplanes sichuanensis]
MSPYHAGELDAQKRAGLLAEAARLSGMFNTAIPVAARDFLAAQPMLVLGTAGVDGRLWATMLTGGPGFLTVTGPSTLMVAAAPAAGDPLHQTLTGPAKVGMIAIEPGTRRRVRMNGTAHPTDGGLRIELEQVYANCPKYIQKRMPTMGTATPGTPRHGTGLTAEEMGFASIADTFFIATTDLDGNADASHRGGDPGFLRVLGPNRLRWPDYAGNSMFNTFGNLQVDSRAGLLLPDFVTGTLLHLSGTAVVDWDPEHAAVVPGAQRLVDFTVEHVVRVDGASPLRWSRPEYSRFNPPPSFEIDRT